MQEGDIVKVDFVIDINNVETLTKQIFEVDSILGGDSLTKVLTDLAGLFWGAFAPLCTPAASLSCVKWVNQDRAEKAIVNPNTVGTAPAGTHPSHQTLNFETYGHANSSDPLRRNRHYISGVSESLSTRGRLNDESLLSAPETYLATSQTTDAAGVVLIPQVRWGRVAGPPVSWNYDAVDYARGFPQFGTHRSRKYRLCV